jgi:S-adenosylmethionine/arginine decarboxylase-like enzyme
MSNVIWSLDLAVDLSICNVDKFNEDSLKEMAQEASAIFDKDAEIIGVVTEFGGHNEEMKGFRIVHENQNSLLTGHFVQSKKKAYINIHSCNPYRPSELIEFLSKFFESESYKVQKIHRE